MYRDNELNARMIYNFVADLTQATRVLVRGRGGILCKKEKLANNFQFFEYRFIKFEYIFERGLFAPIIFQTSLPFDELR